MKLFHVVRDHHEFHACSPGVNENHSYLAVGNNMNIFHDGGRLFDLTFVISASLLFTYDFRNFQKDN